MEVFFFFFFKPWPFIQYLKFHKINQINLSPGLSLLAPILPRTETNERVIDPQIRTCKAYWQHIRRALTHVNARKTSSVPALETSFTTSHGGLRPLLAWRAIGKFYKSVDEGNTEGRAARCLPWSSWKEKEQDVKSKGFKSLAEEILKKQFQRAVWKGELWKLSKAVVNSLLCYISRHFRQVLTV